MLAPPLVFALLGGFLLAHVQRPSYRATAEVIADRATIVGVGAVLPALQPPRDVRAFMRAETLIARSPALAARVVAARGVRGVSPGKLLAASTVTPAVNSDLLRFTVSDSHSRSAILLANTYASEFTRYKAEKDGTAVSGALRSLNVRIESLQAKAATTSPAYATLIQQRAQLETVGKQLSQQASVFRVAADASALRTHTLRNGILGGLLGALLGVGLVVVLAISGSRMSRR
jgi:capsular polysaccharide biosynthesis protein